MKPTETKSLTNTVPFSSAYYAALGHLPMQELRRGCYTYDVDDAAAAAAFLDAGLPDRCNGMAQYFNTAVARRLTRLNPGCLGADPDAFNARGQFERCGRWHPTVGEIDAMTDDQLIAVAAEVAAHMREFDAQERAQCEQQGLPTPAVAGRVQLWERCERCGAEPSYATSNGHLCAKCL